MMTTGTVNIKWTNGRVTGYRILSAISRKVKVRVNGEIREFLSGRNYKEVR